MMTAKYLWEIGSIIITILGIIHLYYTFFTNKFASRNETVTNEMKSSSPILTEELTMWKAWVGFNASHSSGVMFIGIMNFYLAVQYFTILRLDHFFFLFTMLKIGFYVWVAKKYWFSIPFIGVSITLVCFVVSYMLTITNN